MPFPIDGQKIIGKWGVPLRGVTRNVPINEIGPDALYDGKDVLVRGGMLINRPGFTQFTGTSLTGRPTGAFNAASIASGAFQTDAFQNDAFQMAGNVAATLLVVGTTKKLYAYFAGALNDVTGVVTLSALDAQLARFTAIYLYNTAKLTILHTNGTDAVMQWDGTGNFAATAGSPPAFTDLATIASHVLGLVPPYVVRWSNNQDIGTWPVGNNYVASDTADTVVAIRALGVLGGVLYKTRSIYSIYPQGGAEATFFVFQYRGSVDGPAGPAAVTDANGTHYWMTDSGRIGAFDGSNVAWVADGIWPIIQADLDTNNTNRIFAVYEPGAKEIWFFYPRQGDNGDCKGIAIVTMPRPVDGIVEHIAFRGQTSIPLSAGVDLRQDLRKGLVIRTNGVTGTIEGADDLGSSISGFWQTGLQGTPGLEFFSFSACEVFLQRSAGYGNLTVTPTFSNILDAQGGTLGSAKTLNLTTVTVFEPTGNDLLGRFFGLKFSFTTPVTIDYVGARIAGDPRKG